MDVFNSLVIKFLEDNLPLVVNNSTFIFSFSVFLLTACIAVLWFYCGIFMFYDYGKRSSDRSISILLLCIGLLLGPIALLFYLILRPKQTLDDKEFFYLEHRFYYNQASKVLGCMNCEEYVLEGHRFCTSCGTQNRFKCKSCGSLTDYDDNFCFNCGASFEGRYESIKKRMKSRQESRHNSNKIKSDKYSVHDAFTDHKSFWLNLVNFPSFILSVCARKYRSLKSKLISFIDSITVVSQESKNTSN